MNKYVVLIFLLLGELLTSPLHSKDNDKVIPFIEYNEVAGSVSTMMLYILKANKECSAHYKMKRAREVSLLNTWDTQNKRYTEAILTWHKLFYYLVKETYGKDRAELEKKNISQIMSSNSNAMVVDLFKSFDSKQKACQSFEAMVLKGKYNINEKFPYYKKLLQLMNLIETFNKSNMNNKS